MHLGEPRVSCAHTRAADDICVLGKRARPQGTCRSRFPDPKGQAGRDADATLVHTLPDSFYGPGCGDPKCLRVMPQKGRGASRQPLRGSAEPGKPWFQLVKSPRVGDSALDLPGAPGTDQESSHREAGREWTLPHKIVISDNKMSLCDLRGSTRRMVSEFSPQME